MIKINGKELNIAEEDYLIKSLVERKELVKKNNKYFWTKKALEDQIKDAIKIKRCVSNPLWKVYYYFVDMFNK